MRFPFMTVGVFATACRAWREQVYGWREFYAKQQIAINGQAGVWARTPPPGEE